MKDHPKFPEQIETDRLRIAIYEAGDGQDFYHLLQKNAAYLEEELYEVRALKSPDDAETYTKEKIEEWHIAKRFVSKIVERESEEMIGQLWLEPRWEEEVFEVGYFIVEKKQGQGYVTEAVNKAIEILFEDLGVDSLEIQTKVTNIRSINLAKRCGFRLITRIPNVGKTKTGELVDMFHFRLSSGDYQP